MRLIVTNSGNSARQGAHQLAQKFTNRNFPESFLRNAFKVSASAGLTRTGSAASLSRYALTESALPAHLIEQPTTLVFETATDRPASSESNASRRYCFWTDWIRSESSIAPAYCSLRSESK